MKSLVRRLSYTTDFSFLYLANFLVSFHLFLLIYINSSYLNTYITEQQISILFAIGSFLSIVALLNISKLLRILGNYKTLILLSIIEVGILLGLAFVTTTFFVIGIFLAFLFIFPLMLYNLDILLEGYTKGEAKTGRIRGLFLTAGNIALVTSPLLLFIVSDDIYSRVYLVSIAVLIPFIFIISSQFRKFKDPVYHEFAAVQMFKCLLFHKNLKNIFVLHFLMRFFFSWMVIYLPIYLHEHLLFSWSEIGIMFAIMLLPFALFEFPIGRLSDKIGAERLFLTIGFITVISAVAVYPFLPAVFLWWALALFISRAGASVIEIMTESYFFKQVDRNDPNTISAFRMIRPIAYIVGPIAGATALIFLDFQFIFLVLAAILFFGLFFCFKVQNTK